MFKVEKIFPTTIIRTNIDREITSQEFEIVNNHKQDKIKNLGNWTSADSYILDHSFLEIRQFIQTGINYYVENIFAAETLKLRITQSWLNYTENSEHHHKHTHANSILSGVFYFNAVPNVDKINFYDDRTNRNQLTFKTKEWNEYNCESWWIPVRTGDLVIFPSSLNHMVEQTQSYETRISLAFNTFASEGLGDRTTMTEVIL